MILDSMNWKKLREQYEKATGNKYDFNFEHQSRNEFYKWVYRNQTIAEDYLKFLKFMGALPEEESKIAEVGKYFDDTITLDNNINMITPCVDNIYYYRAKPGDQLIIGQLIIRDKKFEVIAKDDVLDFDRYITQNPYNEYCIKNWERAHNNGINITVGVYGSIYDKDYQSKIDSLKLLKEKLEKEYKEGYATIGDSYFYAIASDREHDDEYITPAQKLINKKLGRKYF